jgi:hypothetical protein
MMTSALGTFAIIHQSGRIDRCCERMRPRMKGYTFGLFEFPLSPLLLSRNDFINCQRLYSNRLLPEQDTQARPEMLNVMAISNPLTQPL